MWAILSVYNSHTPAPPFRSTKHIPLFQSAFCFITPLNPSKLLKLSWTLSQFTTQALPSETSFCIRSGSIMRILVNYPSLFSDFLVTSLFSLSLYLLLSSSHLQFPRSSSSEISYDSFFFPPLILFYHALCLSLVVVMIIIFFLFFLLLLLLRYLLLSSSFFFFLDNSSSWLLMMSGVLLFVIRLPACCLCMIVFPHVVCAWSSRFVDCPSPSLHHHPPPSTTIHRLSTITIHHCSATMHRCSAATSAAVRPPSANCRCSSTTGPLFG